MRPMTHRLRQCISAREGLRTKNTSWALIERPYSCAPQALGTVYDRPGFFVQSAREGLLAQAAKRRQELIPGRKPWESHRSPATSPGGAIEESVCRPLRDSRFQTFKTQRLRAGLFFHAASRLGEHALAAVLILLGVTLSLHAQASWNFAGPPGAPPRVVRLASDPRSDFTLYFVAPGGGVWKSTDGGSSWVPLTDLLSSLQVCSIAIDSRSPDVLYVGTGDDQNLRPLQTVVRSPDGGRTWTTGPRFTNQPVCALAVDPANSLRIFAGSAEGLFLSQDAGTSWSKIVPSPVASIAFDDLGSVYVGVLGDNSGGSFNNVLIRSSDGGSTWANISLPASPYASDARTTWVSVVADANALSVTVSYQLSGQGSGANPSLIDFYRSTDGGNTWSEPVRVGAGHPPNQLVLDSASGNLYVAGDSLMASTNQGISWFNVSSKTPRLHSAVTTGDVLLLAGDGGLEMLPLMGSTPTRAIRQLPLGQFLSASLDSQNAVWAAGPAGLFGPLGGKISDSVGTVSALANSSNIFATGNQAIYLSGDGGTQFSSSKVLADGELRAPFPPLVVDPVNPSSAFVAGSRLYRTSNAGDSWTVLPAVDSDPTHVVIALTMAPAQRTTLYAATACLPEVVLTSCPPVSLIWRSQNSGQTWTRMGSVSGYVNRLAVDPRQNNTVYAAIGGFPAGTSLSAGYLQGDLQQSTNGGGIWTSLRTNLPNVPVNAIVIDPTSLPPLVVTPVPLPTFPGQPPGPPFGPGQFQLFNQPAQTIYVATDAGVFVTFNVGGGGNVAASPQWTDISWGLPPVPVTDISLRQPDGILLAATFGRGVYSISAKGLAAGIVVNSLSISVTLMKGTTLAAGVPLFNVASSNTLGWRLNAYDGWLGIPEANGTLRPRGSGEAVIRISAAGLQPGIHVGRLQFISGSFVQTVFVTARVTEAPAQMTMLSGNNGLGGVGAALPPLQVLVSDANQNPLNGVPVDFAIVNGGGSLSSRTAFTNAAGIAGTVLTLPPNRGTVQVLATVGDLSVTFTVTAVDAPALLQDSVVDGVTFNSYTALGPGSIVSITGEDLAQTTVLASAGTLPTVLATTRVWINTPAGDMALPLLSVSPAQVRALLPTDISAGVYGLRVEAASSRSNEVQISIAAFAPGILTQSGNGRGLGIFIKDDASVVTASNPADRGSIVTLFATGLGPVNPSIGPGEPGATEEPLNRTIAAPRVFFDTYPADVLYSGLVPGVAGRYQVTVRVPALVSPATNISVSLVMQGFASNRVTIPVR